MSWRVSLQNTESLLTYCTLLPRHFSSRLPPASPRRLGVPSLVAKRLKGHRPNPKIFGHQKGTHVGQWWTGRMGCSQDGVHAPPVSGISGNEHVGAWSIALSGGYEDDIDVGYAFTFTGESLQLHRYVEASRLSLGVASQRLSLTRFATTTPSTPSLRLFSPLYLLGYVFPNAPP